MPGHGSPKFDEPWMDELDGEHCIQRTTSFAIQGALIGEYIVDLTRLIFERNETFRLIESNSDRI